MMFLKRSKRFCRMCGQPQGQRWLSFGDVPFIGYWICKNNCIDPSEEEEFIHSHPSAKVVSIGGDNETK